MTKHITVPAKTKAVSKAPAKAKKVATKTPAASSALTKASSLIKTEKNLKATPKNKYVTDNQIGYVSEREDCGEVKEIIKNLFTVSSDDDFDLCGNVQAYFDAKTGQAVLSSDFNMYRDPNFVCMQKQISSALLLYRSISLFECGLNAEICDFYKVNWAVVLTHKESGLKICLSEWKGGASIRTPGRELKGFPASYVKSVELLLSLLTSPKMTIGYDGTVAGSVA